VDRAGADDDEQAAVFAVEDVDDLVTSFEDGGGGCFGDRQFCFDGVGWEDNFGPGDAKVICGEEHGSHLDGVR